MTRRWPQHLRWGACFALALTFHAAGAAALLARWNETSDLVANAPLIMVDLAPVAVAPTTTPTEMPPDIVESKLVEPAPEPEPEPELPKQVELQPDPAPEPELAAVLPPPKPPEKKKVEKKKPPQRTASIARAASSADNQSDRAAAPMPGASARDSNAMPNWTSQLVSRLERHKRYPSEAQSRGETGVVRLAFSVDRSGGVHNVRIVGSSGSSLLDRETLSMVARAAPLPAPPPEMGSTQIAVVVPIRYNMR